MDCNFYGERIRSSYIENLKIFYQGGGGDRDKFGGDAIVGDLRQWHKQD